MAKDGLTEVLAAPMRATPGKLPDLGAFTNVRRKHVAMLEQLAKATEKREELIAKLGRADAKVRDLRKAVARSSKRMEEARAAANRPNDMHDDPLPQVRRR